MNWRGVLIFLFFQTTLYAQDIWPLEVCIDSAIANNVRLKQVDLNTETAVVNYKQTKYDFTPTISAGGNYSFGSGRFLNQVSNEFETGELVQTAQLSLSGNLVLFNGMLRYYNLKNTKLSIDNEAFNKEIEMRNVKLNVLTSYLQVLLSSDLIQLSKDHLNYTQEQEKRMRILIESEMRTDNDLIEIFSQKSSDQLQLTRAENDLELSMRQLIQTMQIKHGAVFMIDTATADRIVEKNEFEGVEKMPELKQRDLMIEQAILNKKMNQSSYYPTLSLSTGIYTSYADNELLLSITPQGDSLFASVFEKLELYSSQSIGFNLSIPIYNQHRSRTNVQLSEIAIENARFEKEQLALELMGTIDQLHIDIKNAFAELKAAETFLENSQKDFEQTQVRFENGLLNYSELLNKKDRLYTAQSNFVQSKYNYYFKTKILTLYNE